MVWKSLLIVEIKIIWIDSISFLFLKIFYFQRILKMFFFFRITFEKILQYSIRIY